MFTVNANFLPAQLKRRPVSPPFSGVGLHHTAQNKTLSHKDSFHRSNQSHSLHSPSGLASQVKGFSAEKEREKEKPEHHSF